MKLLIGVCAWYDPKYQCVDALWRLQKPDGIDKMEIFYSVAHQSAASRNAIILKAKNEGYDYILFVDSDSVCHQADTVIKLLDGLKQTNSLIISGICRQSLKDHKAAISPDNGQDKDKWNVVMLEDVPRNVFQVNMMGFGIVLAKTELFDKIESPYFQWIEDPGVASEDLYFCEKVRNAGIPMYAHGGVRIGHLKQIMI